ncbi:tRNA lysidine(34) synthetase TilS [Desulforamulus ferrireducens]|uniref:tRNA(Ile)-lysidine synthase n=1 Tax=Desulforamulus ferrireducens TaxID=1833852 RepID=A0A1S6ISY2_9FIRM|nr:tRNA lysidine(34) synthetase TilS [Desulforamulus ferrireducens]AQS57875.1 tRNA lysidine(34) synthetase TilS [Desulforamulus ferrireducens]
MGVLEKVRTALARYRMVEPGQLVVVGVSGGADSMALLHILQNLAPELEISLHVAHLNHMFRGEESQADADFVEEYCSRSGIPCTIDRRDVPAYARVNRLSSQVAAREVRYQFFYEVLRQTQGQKLALAHHANDQAESVLMNFLRGAGLRGLGGIAPVREDLIIRPLLSTHREEIENYCRENAISYRIDSSNLKTVYRRNKLRHHLIPLLQREYSPSIIDVLGRLAEQARSEDELLEQLTRETYQRVKQRETDKEITLNRQLLAQQPVALIRRVLRLSWEKLRGHRLDLTFEHIENLVGNLAGGGPERIWELPGGIKVRLATETVTLMSDLALDSPGQQIYQLPVPGSVLTAAGQRVTAEVLTRAELEQDPREFPLHMVALDYAKVQLPLQVRFRQDGDVFVPFGLGKEVKLKKLLIDRKIPRHQRDTIPLVLEQPTGRILWVAGVRMADQIGITSETKKLILLRLENGNSSNRQIDNK